MFEGVSRVDMEEENSRLREGEVRAEAQGKEGPGCKGPYRHRMHFGFDSGENEKPLEYLGAEE